jgi:hypothetical protein
MKTELIPFTRELLPDAGRLLAQRHHHNRLALPELPARFEEVEVTTKAIESVFGKKTTRGFGAIRHGKLVAYLLVRQ